MNSVVGRLRPVEHAPRWQHVTVLGLYVLTIAMVVLALIFGARYFQSRSEQREEAREGMLRRSLAAASAIDAQASSGEAFTTSQLKSNMDWLVLKEFGYGMILASDGEVVADGRGGPARKTLSGFPENQRQFLQGVIDRAAKGESATVELDGEVFDGPAVISFAAIQSRGWTVIFVARDDEIYFRSQESKQALIRFLPAVVFSIIFLALLLSRAYAGSLCGLWAVAIISSACFIAGIALIWYWEVATPPRPDVGGPSLAESVHEYKKYLADEFDGKESIDIRTGVFLNLGQLTCIGCDFASTDEALAKGLAWQHVYDRFQYSAETGGEALQTLHSGFILPDASDAQFEQLYFYREGLDETTGWTFTAKLRHSFDASHFPIDRSAIEIRMWHQDFEREVLLLPDLASYQSAVATTRPGLADSFQVPGWRTEGSYFTYRTVDHDAGFGLVDPTLASNSTELVFIVPIRRYFVHPFVSSVLPLSIVALLLFWALLINTKMERAKFAIAGGSKTMGGATGSPTYGLISVSIVVSYTGALLFAVILAHSRLRGEIPAAGLLYLEYFFFVVYFAIVAVSMNTLLYASHLGGGFIHFRDNLIPRVMYWPLITGALFAVTWIAFY